MHIEYGGRSLELEAGGVRVLPVQGEQSIRYGFEWNGVPFVLKRITNSIVDEFRPELCNTDPGEVVRFSRLFYQILKQEMGDLVIDAEFQVLEDEQGQRFPAQIYPFLDGISLEDIVTSGDGGTALEMNDVVERFRTMFRGVLRSKQVMAEFPEMVRFPDYFAGQVRLSSVIKTAEDTYVLVDW
ncbi:hypothetical protein M1555_05060 [Patescibacteria group bacterium]|nr:hypothetical protein [Patescibacteria group bacterium]